MEIICLKGGCPEAKENRKVCVSCGFERHERQRRLQLGLEELPSGLKGIVLRKDKSDDEE